MAEHVFVNQDDIDYAKKQDRWSCAIVRAIQRENPEALFVKADIDTIAYSENGHRYTHNTPEIAIKRIIKPLDEGRDVRPFGFDLGPATVKEVKKLTPEKKEALRRVDRNRTEKEKAQIRKRQASRTHN